MLSVVKAAGSWLMYKVPWSYSSNVGYDTEIHAQETVESPHNEFSVAWSIQLDFRDGPESSNETSFLFLKSRDHL